jgi:hypothetical protein
MFSVLPFSTLSSELIVVLNSTMKTNFDISYKCRFGAQFSDAILIGSQFKCLLKRINPVAHSLNVSIEAYSNYKKNSLTLTANEVEFYFLSNI